MKRFLLGFVLLGFVATGAMAQVSVTNGSPSFLIDFSNSMPTTVGTNPSTAFAGAGFEPNPTTSGRLNSNAWAVTGFSDGDLAFGGTNNLADYTRGATVSSVTTGGIYAFAGAPGSAANPTLMIQPGSSDFTPGNITLRIVNNGTTNITQLSLSYNLYVNNDQNWSNSFNFSHSSDNVTYTSVPALDYSSAAASDGLGWILVGTAPSRSTVITGLNVTPGSYFYLRWTGNDVTGSGSRDEFGLDDINVTATFALPNTITTGTVSSPPFVLANCAANATGTVDFTSTDVYNVGNVFTAQLSDDIGSFTSPVNIGSISLSGTAPSGTINITIPPGTAGGTGYKIRVVSDNPTVTGSESATFTIVQSGIGGCSSSHTDYYRSSITGNWTDPNTWESSPDNTNWITATLAPTFLANTILIRNTHTVTIDGLSSADQLTIESGGILNHSNGSLFTLNDGSGTDMTINSGGIYVLNGNQPISIPTATVDVLNGAIVRVDGNSSPGESDDFAFGASATVNFSTGSIYDWNTNTQTPSWTNRNYFTIGQDTKFRFTQQPNFPLGGGQPTVIYGHLEANVNLTFQGTATKTIKNGIIGTGNIDATTVGSGAIIIDGATSVLGGGSLDLQTGVPLQITGSNVTMSSSKIINGDVALASNSMIVLGNNDLTVSGSISGYGTSSYVQTNGTGYLKMNAIGGTRVFPVGFNTFNACYINNGGLNDYSVRVENGITPSPALPTFGINRTWYILSSAAGTADVSFVYATAHANAGVTTQPQPMEILQYTGGVWSITVGNQGINPGGADPQWIVTSLSPVAVNTTATPNAVGKSGGWILPLNCIVNLKAMKVNNSGKLTWNASSCSEVNSFELQRSVNNGVYQTISIIRPLANETDFEFSDRLLASGINQYRIKINGLTGATKFSNVVALIHETKDILITSISPNPATSLAKLQISTGKMLPVSFVIYNTNGAIVKRWSSVIAEGNAVVDVEVARLPAGVYTIMAVSGTSKASIRLVKQ